MEVSSSTFHLLFSPSAAYSDLPAEHNCGFCIHHAKNTTLSCDHDHLEGRAGGQSTWVCQGRHVRGNQFFMTPTWATGKTPLFVDVWVTNPPRKPEDKATNTTEHASPIFLECIPRSQLTTMLLESLEHHLPNTAEQQAMYFSLPFGSRLVFSAATYDESTNSVIFRPEWQRNHSIESQWLSLAEIQDRFDHIDLDKWPEVVELNALRLHHRSHDSVATVQIPRVHSTRLFIFKARTYDMDSLYHELGLLLSLSGHKHVMAPPLFLVSHQRRWGHKQGICGFILPYYENGTLYHALKALEADNHHDREHSLHSGSFSVQDKTRIGKQVVQALQHIHHCPVARYYPDLKPENIMLVKSDGIRIHAERQGYLQDLSALLIDLEQGGGWYSWAPPEVFYLYIIEFLALARSIPETVQQRHAELLERLGRLSPHNETLGPSAPTSAETVYYRATWRALNARQQEAAVVFMFGKLLWCIFEERSGLRNGMGIEMLHEVSPAETKAQAAMTDKDGCIFPKFSKTPEEVRKLIRQCTIGAPEWKTDTTRCLHLEGDPVKAYVIDSGAKSRETCRYEGPSAHAVSKAWWKEAATEAEMFAEAMCQGSDYQGILADAATRPSFAQVLQALTDIEEKFV